MVVGEMEAQEAVDLLDERVKSGGTLVAVAQGALPAVKRLRDRCLDAGIPSMLGPCAPGG